ncbi:glycolate oxidase subunit GlcF [Thiohalophilus thiocyanatoxydans]|uniref:Glycolate oxidase iron-sulfur subunit n=1 Tax=Thiohalophilus thiocyanatoxydans TaxID=381308 RepID=A0A4R8IXB8_9GAMM|nr:glycolate oxidase subunit GlcF [Thiohalophilus thiocyanatoxydans]TDY04210.1 glycolate oxidase iron-sulfur subunit [Thiohalophilus thiocyanatoxydans]
MQTNLSQQFLNTPEGREANDILRACVHCGFCTATCPTYQLLGDELDGPRGRIYLIKQALEGNAITGKTQQHLDRCLTCRACETTCPSGVRYGRLVEIGREVVDREVRRGNLETLQRWLLRKVVPYPRRMQPLIKAGNLFKPFMPASLANKVPTLQNKISRPEHSQPRKMLVLEGCVQSVSTPNTNAVTARVLDKLGIELISAERAGCCGAVSHHLSAAEEGLDFMRNNIAAWWPHIEAGAEAIVITASGCGAMVKEYGDLLKHDPAWAAQAARVSELSKDISEVLANEDLSQLENQSGYNKIAFHSPCTLQHGQQINGVVESILQKAGYTLTHVPDSHLCCGSAGTYSILQPTLSQQLLDNKLTALQGDEPDVIVTANIGCQMHLASKAGKPVRHWIELLDGTV